MNQADMNDAQHALLMDVRRSIRYHDRRRAFFDTLHRTTLVLTILLSSSVLIDIARPGPNPFWLVAISAFAAILAAVDIVVSYSAKAELHRSLKVRFNSLEKAILTGGTSSSEWATHHSERLSIESDEPPVYRALDTLCHNELSASVGNDDIYPVSCLQRLTCHLFHWPDIASS